MNNTVISVKTEIHKETILDSCLDRNNKIF